MPRRGPKLSPHRHSTVTRRSPKSQCSSSEMSTTWNIGTEDRLVNGVMGTVTSIEWPENMPVPPERQPTVIHVMFDNERVGQKNRQFVWEREGNIM